MKYYRIEIYEFAEDALTKEQIENYYASKGFRINKIEEIHLNEGGML